MDRARLPARLRYVSSQPRRVAHRGRRSAARIAWIALALVAATVVPVVALRWVRPPTTTVMLIERLAGGATGGGCSRIEHRWVPWRAISPHIPIAIVAAEDQRFPNHAGFDFDSIAASLRARGRTLPVRGASTISQQVAKNLFLWSGRSWVRKGLEAYFTVLIETLWPKRRILEMYANVAEFGRCTFGVGAASWRFFDRPAATLGPREAALLAAVLPNPARFHANRPSTYLRRRASWISDQVRRLGGSTYLGSL
jgi:monofunctional biosynthetic peptidoglycan transglycosylase